MEALGSIFFDTIEEQREYYYFDSPALTEIFDDGVFNRTIFHELSLENATHDAIRNLKLTHLVVGGDDAFVAKVMTKVGDADVLVVRLA